MRDDGFVWFWFEKELNEEDEGKSDDGHDYLILFSRKCPECGAKLVWVECRKRLVCPKCDL